MEFMFSGEIRRFEKLLKTLQRSVDRATEKIDKLETKVDTLVGKFGEHDKKFKACADGFYQVKQACECLREELSEASGTLIEATYNDL